MVIAAEFELDLALPYQVVVDRYTLWLVPETVELAAK